jgi:predicted nucleic-acid-binding Zn-ribbon protein
MDIEARLTENFCCSKCRSRTAVAKTVPLSRSLPSILSLATDKYVLVSCTLCGFTEMYNTHAFATLEETAAEPSELPQQL